MYSKPPSSLDYDGHLHELALNNWRRALRERDLSRAEINALTLTRSHDKFWRFVGGVHLALTHLCGGHITAALDAFAGAAGAYPEARELVSIAKTQSAHVHLETNSPRMALEALEDVAITPATRYWRALAHARLSETEAARNLVGELDDDLFRAHVLVELGNEDDIDLLRSAVELIPNNALASASSGESPQPTVPILYALATRLFEQNQHAEAAATFADIAARADAILQWPLPYARALYRVGEQCARDPDGDVERAREAYAEFLHLWRDGEIDREAIAEASQFVKS